MRPSTTPSLNVSGFALRPIALSDADDWYAYLSMPGVLAHTSWNLASADELREAIARYNVDDPASPIRFALHESGGGPVVGTVGFHSISPAHRTAELAYDLHPALWGRGLASACARAAVAWGLFERSHARIQAVVLDTNAPSIRVLERTGFEREGMLRNYRTVRGEPRDFWMYSIIPSAGGS